MSSEEPANVSAGKNKRPRGNPRPFYSAFSPSAVFIKFSPFIVVLNVTSEKYEKKRIMLLSSGDVGGARYTS